MVGKPVGRASIGGRASLAVAILNVGWSLERDPGAGRGFHLTTCTCLRIQRDHVPVGFTIIAFLLHITCP